MKELLARCCSCNTSYYGDFASGIEEAILGPMRSSLIGQDITQFQQLLQHIQMSCIGNSSAKAAVDMALYDVYCQYHNVPLYALLGGKRNSHRYYCKCR